MTSRGTLFSLPNIVSFSRVLLAAGFVGMSEPRARVAIIGVASATDFLDGWLARRNNSASRWGALIDPLADRIFALVALSVFLAEGRLTTLQFCLLLLRDIMTAVGFLTARLIPWLRPVEFVARPLGKVVTVLQLAAFIAVLLLPAWIQAMVVLVVLVSLASITDYTLVLWRARAR